MKINMIYYYDVNVPIHILSFQLDYNTNIIQIFEKYRTA